MIPTLNFEDAKCLIQAKFKDSLNLKAMHSYTDVEGKPMFYRLRLTDPKSGTKRIFPLSHQNQQWELKEPDFKGKKPLYNLHALTAQDVVFFVEGESCVDTLNNLGIVATTSGGATSHEKADYLPLAGKAVYIWPDNDDAGASHAEAVALRLTEHGCRVEMISVQELGLPKGGDVIDWLTGNPNAIKDDIFNLAREKLVLNANPVRVAGREQLAIAKAVIADIGMDNLIYSLGDLWKWNESGAWQKADDREIKQSIHRVCSTENISASLVNSSLDLIKTETYRPGLQFDTLKDSINCLNGEITFVDGSWRLMPHEKTSYRTTVIPVAYDPIAKAPRFEKFLMEVFAGDADAADKIKIVLEAIGYTLLPTTYLEKFVMLIGGGANGKSVLLGVLSSLVGKSNAVAIQPDQFENQFQRAHLQGKLANIVTEIKEGGEIADAQLKSLVSGELTTAELKFRDAFEFYPFATHWFGTNHMPHTRDFSDALFRRAIILTFNNKFDGANKDVNLGDKLKCELPGILNLALAGVARLYKQQSFTTSVSSDQAINDWKLDADQVAQFVADQCKLEKGSSTASLELYNKYREWSVEAGIRKVLGRKNFTGRLIRLGCSLDRGTGGLRRIQGIEINDSPPSPF
jgi:putative DNA primase/helicase